MNKVFFKLISFGLIPTLILAMLSCEPCEECGPENASPYFKLTILNKTSLDTLNEDNTRFKNDLTTTKEALNNPEFSGKTDSLNAQVAIIEDSIDILTDLIRITKARLISIEQINGESNLFENDQGGDSLVNFRIPLDPNNTFSDYVIKIEGTDQSNNLSVSYTLKDSVIESRITKAAFDFKVESHNYDSINGPRGCSKEVCISNELTLYVEI